MAKKKPSYNPFLAVLGLPCTNYQIKKAIVKTIKEAIEEPKTKKTCRTTK